LAVYKRAYKPYDGPLTSERWRFLVLPRFAFQEVFESKILTIFLVACFVPALVETVIIYVANSAPAQAMLGLTGEGPAKNLMKAEFFMGTLTIQGFLAFFLTAYLAPVLVSPDLVNGALPLYLSRPFSRAEYVLGKASVLLLLLSFITWVPLLWVYSLQAGLAPAGWLLANLRIGAAILVGALIWISVLTLLGLGLSALIRWRIVASAALVGIFFMGTAFGEIWREVLRNPWGRLANLPYLIGIVWTNLFGISTTGRRALAREMLDDRRSTDLPVWAAWMGLLAVCAFALWVLNRRLRAREVVA
jgi:ABC-2 type transport system permease protein